MKRKIFGFRLYKPFKKSSSDLRFSKYLQELKWRKKIEQIMPIQFFIRHEIPFFLKFSLRFLQIYIRKVERKIYYWLYPNNVVKIRSLPTTWYDKDVVLLHACFQILVDYVEKEKPHEKLDWAYHEKDLNRVMHLYNWWKEAQTKSLEIWQEEESVQEDYYKTVQEKLHELIDMRFFLWT